MKARLLLAFAAVLFAAPMICAQSQVRIKIPFPFTLNNTEHPAGVWAVGEKESNPNLLIFTRVGGGESFFVSTLRATVQGASKSDEAVFNVYEGKYFLSEIRRIGKNGFYFAPGKTERELLAVRTKAEKVAVIAGAK